MSAFRTLHLHQAEPQRRMAREGITGDIPILFQNDTAGWWNSQAGQDYTIERLFRAVPGAHYFVDLAANHAVYLSNTRALERDHGWLGLCIEGNEMLMLELLRYRQCKVYAVLVGAQLDEPVHFVSEKNDGLSHISGRPASGAGNQLPSGYTMPLVNVLRHAHAPKVIDYLSLDVEGSEENVLLGLPVPAEYSIRAITVERPSMRVKDWLLARNYTYVFDHGWWGDELWLSADFPGGSRAAAELAKEEAHGWVDWYCHRGYWASHEDLSVSRKVCADPQAYVQERYMQGAPGRTATPGRRSGLNKGSRG